MTDFDIRYSAMRRALIELEFQNLNDRQKDGVFKTEGPVLILAGAGSGKTTVLINRIINLLRYGRGYECEEAPEFAGDYELSRLALALSDENAVPDEEKLRLCAVDPPKPYEIIAITFTNKAAGELRDRLNIACGEQGLDIWAHTFHSACSRILRSHIDKIGYTRDFAIYDEDDKKKLLITVMKELNIDEKRFEIRGIISEISHAKDSLISPDEYAANAGEDPYRIMVGRIYDAYSARMRELNALDFDDIIVKTVELLRTRADVLEYYQHKFKYVLVDEYQDTNHAQYELCRLLADGWRNLCVVGDDDQSIYKFRGATIENILNFEKGYPDAMTIRLEQNYRSTGSILNAANGVIACNRGRKGKNLWTDRGNGELVTFYSGDTQEDEGQYISSQIIGLRTSGSNYRDCCVLYRNHALSNSIEQSFKRNGIPYHIVSGLRFFDRAEVKDMLSYLCFINNTCDAVRLKRIINTPTRGIGATTQEKIFTLARENGVSEYEIMQKAADFPEISRAQAHIAKFVELIEYFRNTQFKLMELYDYLLDKTGYLAALDELPQSESRTKKENVLELRSNIAEYCEKTENPTLSGFLEEIALFTDIDSYDENTDCVTMMTIHSAKGLEFDNVFICGAEEGLFPSFRSLESTAETEEERRLCYVAMTRARKKLYITCTEHRMLYGNFTYAKPSRFISEIPAECLKKIEKPTYRPPVQDFSEKRKQAKENFFIKREAPKPSAELNRFVPGQKVAHKAFGNGVIAEITPMGNDIMMRISFEKAGDKLMMAKTASKFITLL